MADSRNPLDAGDDRSGFLSRWSRRKVQVRQGAVPPDSPALPAAAAQPGLAAPVARPELTGAVEVAGPVQAAPPPTLEEAAQLTPASDFTRFVARGVDAPVKNAALRRLFSDPHFNIMDGLDTYIDDYGLPDPIPPAMLRQMTQSHLLGLFSSEPSTDPATDPATDENTDLRLQPHDAAGHEGDCPDPGADPGGEQRRAGDDAHPAVPA